MNSKTRQNKKTASNIERTRRMIEGMGVDCKLGVALHKQGVTMEELKILAKGDVVNFLRKAGDRLTPEQKRVIAKKYLF